MKYWEYPTEEELKQDLERIRNGEQNLFSIRLLRLHFPQEVSEVWRKQLSKKYRFLNQKKIRKYNRDYWLSHKQEMRKYKRDYQHKKAKAKIREILQELNSLAKHGNKVGRTDGS